MVSEMSMQLATRAFGVIDISEVQNKLDSIEQLESKLKAQQEQINEANEHIAFICRKLDEAREEGLQYFPIITRSVLHKELSDYVNKHKIKEELAKMEAR